MIRYPKTNPLSDSYNVTQWNPKSPPLLDQTNTPIPHVSPQIYEGDLVGREKH